MRTRTLGWLCVGLLCGARLLWGGEASTLDALKRELKELTERVNVVRAKRDGLRAEITKSPEMAPLHQAYEKASEAYEAKKKTDPAYSEARKAEQDAGQALDKLVRDKVAASEEGKAVVADVENIRKQMAELREAESLARKKLDEIRRKIEKGDDADLQAARAKLDDARKARDEATKSEELTALSKARDDARTVYEAKRKELEGGNNELAAAVKEREELRQQLQEVEKKIREATPGEK